MWNTHTHALRYSMGMLDLRISYTRGLARLCARDRQLNLLYALSHSEFAGFKDNVRLYREYDSDEWWCRCIWFLETVTCGSVNSYGRNKAHVKGVVSRIEHIRSFKELYCPLQCRQQQEIMINSTPVYGLTIQLQLSWLLEMISETLKQVTVELHFFKSGHSAKL